MASQSSSLTPLNRIRKIKIGPLVKEHEAVLLDDAIHLSEEDFDCLLDYLDGMNIHVKVLKRNP